MSEPLGQQDFNQLLAELEQRVLAHPNLALEYEEAHEFFLDGSVNDAPTKLRFREWFLVERDSESLGAPPAVAWAPDDLQDLDIWQYLLESFFGIFQAVACDDQQRPILEDLWSGRQIRLDRPLPAHDDNLVIVGRCAQGSSETHVLLPSVVFIAADGLGDALASDLSRMRAEQPRSKLSQRQSERLLLPFREQPEPQLQVAQALEQLEIALAGEAHWNADRLLEIAVELGATEALNQLAFATTANLEPIRTALATLQNVSALQELESAENSALPSVEEEVSKEEIAAALAAFEQARRAGKDLSGSFEALERTLGVPLGESDPFAEIAPGSEVAKETIGPDDVPGMSMWLATFLWEKEVAGVTIEEHEAREIGAFMEHLLATRGANLDPEEVSAGDLLGYLLRSQNLEILATRMEHLDGFATWLLEEQGAPLAETINALQEGSGSLLRKVVALNQQLEKQGAAKEAIAWLKSVAPLQVEAEDGELVAVVGIPAAHKFHPTVGDCLMGSWRNARFHLGAWLPKQLLPQVQVKAAAE